ncbi:MAG TPA: TIGR03118 family protein [Thermoanaerobaculia bacterium]|nr:TIGR03118 family protein [Thermoanaerobaculia bacterium]
MSRFLRIGIPGALLVVSLLGTKASAAGGGYVEKDLVVNQKVGNVPQLTDANGIVHTADFFDANLVNPWGISESSSSFLWVSDNGSHQSTLYNSAGSPQSLVVAIPAPPPGDPLAAAGAPTGTAFNITFGTATAQFMISGFTSGGVATTQTALFLFVTEDGTILGWNPGVNPMGTPMSTAGKHAIIAVDNSGSGAVYKGTAVATDSGGTTRLYATNFAAGKVEVYDGNFSPASGLPDDAFVDPQLPKNYSPFNVAVISGKIFVTYALKETGGEDDVSGQGHGIVDTYDLLGNFLSRFAQHGQLDSPWGMALAPSGFGELAGMLLIGNFGNGHINAFNPVTGEFFDKLRDGHGQAIVIDGLWALQFGNGVNGGHSGTLYFTAGPNEEADGLFGSLSSN